jgi:hypothetical protein
MCKFLQDRASSVIGMLSGWDRLRLRGTLRSIAYPETLDRFFASTKRLLKSFGAFAEESSGKMRATGLVIAKQAGRPYQYLENPGVSKEQIARQITERDNVSDGLICTLGAVEPCWSFALAKNPDNGHIELKSAYRKCLHYYHYFLHPIFGFMHVRVQTWLPFNLHLCINGREWLARQMKSSGIESLRKDNCFVWVDDVPGAQKLLDQQVRFNWTPALNQLADWVNPAVHAVMAPWEMEYYWSIDESEWATDLMFRSTAHLSRLYPSLIRHGIESLGSRDVMRFLGQRVPLHGNCHRNDCREIVSDVKHRPEGIRIKHRLQNNSVKMYNKQGSVLRVEATLNNVRELKTPRRVQGKVVWRPMRKGVCDARRRAKVSDAANRRYLDAMASVSTPTPLKTLTRSLSEPAKLKNQQVRGLNLLGEADAKLLEVVGRGEYLINGLRNRDLQTALFANCSDDSAEKRRRSGQVTRRLRMLRAHGLIKKVPHTHRYLVTDKGREVITALLLAREADVTKLAKAA